MYPLSNCMPSTNSSSMPKVLDSSTVTTPSLPTLSRASAMVSPISVDAAEMDATCAISSFESISLAWAMIASTAAATPFSIPRFRAMGLAPAATLRMPRWTMAQARTVAVVVPSPATSLVFVATSLASWAPMFSHGSSSSISLAIVTPSLVMVGAPHFLSRTTLRPFGPSVTRTTLASLSTPASSARRASASNSNCLAMVLRFLGRSAGTAGCLLGDDGEDVARGQDQVLLAVVLDLGAAVLGVDDRVAHLDVERHPLAVLEAPGADRDDLALLGLLLGGVRDDNARGGCLLTLARLDDDPVLERLKIDAHRFPFPIRPGQHQATEPTPYNWLIRSPEGELALRSARILALGT